MTDNKFSLISDLGSDGYVCAEDVLTLRRTIFADGIVDDVELDALFHLAERAPDGDREWAQYFSEAVADYYLREEEPAGYLTEAEFKTLRQRVTSDRAKASPFEFGMLLKLMEDAIATPPAMTAFVGEQIKKYILEKSDGVVISGDDAALIRRFIFAAGGDGNVAVTRTEVELLFDLSDATAEADNDPAWTDLFTKAVSNHLMAHIGYKPMGRANALAMYTKSFDDGGPIPSKRGDENIAETASRVFADLLGNIFTPKRAHRARVERRYELLNKARGTEAATAEAVTDDEAQWLIDRITRDGRLHKDEQALIAYMRDDLGARLPAALTQIANRAA